MPRFAAAKRLRCRDRVADAFDHYIHTVNACQFLDTFIQILMDRVDRRIRAQLQADFAPRSHRFAE